MVGVTCAYQLSAETIAVSLNITQYVSMNESIIIILLTCIEDKDVIDNSLLPITLSPPENDQKLTELRRRVAIPRRWRHTIELSLLAIARSASCGCCRLDDFALKAYVCATASAIRRWSRVDLDHVPSELYHFIGLIWQAITFLTLNRGLPGDKRLHLLL